MFVLNFVVCNCVFCLLYSKYFVAVEKGSFGEILFGNIILKIVYSMYACIMCTYSIFAPQKENSDINPNKVRISIQLWNAFLIILCACLC